MSCGEMGGHCAKVKPIPDEFEETSKKIRRIVGGDEQHEN